MSENAGANGLEQRAARWVNVLGRQPGTRAEKLKWLVANLELIEAEAEASFAAEEPTDKALSAKTKSLIFRWWRNERNQRKGRSAGSRWSAEEIAEIGARRRLLRERKKPSERPPGPLAAEINDVLGKIKPVEVTVVDSTHKAPF